jgi:hydrogenase-4 component B
MSVNPATVLFSSLDGRLIFLIFALCAAGAMTGLALSDRRSPVVLAWAGSLAAVSAVVVSGRVLWSGTGFSAAIWRIEPVGLLSISIDRLSALFLLAAGIVMLAASVFSASYLRRYAGRYSLRAMNAWFLLLFASVVLILIAHDVLLFLLAWEAMSITSYLLVNFEHRRPEASRAGFLMLAMGEGGFAAIILVLLFLGVRAGSLEFPALQAAAAGLGPTSRWLIFLLGFFGFGVKAGLVPVNTWLPRAHPVAPANVSAMLSGVILNLGLYGILRLNFELVPVTAVGAGLVMLSIGTVSALLGILYATTERDLKTLLAHSSVENVGIVVAGLGAGAIFVAYGHSASAAIAFTASLYHMINHSVYKALLFLGAGNVDAQTGTRNLDKLGGLLRSMPWTGAVVLVGAVSIAGLPPFNGFASEWLTLQSLLRAAELSSTGARIVFALCGAGLALTAALAVTCFVKMFAMGFLGMARSPGAATAVEARRSAVVPLATLAVLCLLLGVLPAYVIGALDPVSSHLAGASAVDTLVPPFFAAHPAHGELPPAFAAEFHDLGAQTGETLLPGRGLVVLHRGGASNPVVFAMSTTYMLVVLLGLLLLTWVVLRLGLTRRRRLSRRERWAGGLRRLSAEMTYTATGFSNPVRVIFDAVFRPTTMEDARETVAEHFRTAVRREREQVHLVDRLIFRPAGAATLLVARLLAAMHHGRINAYVAYVLLALILALATAFLW